MWSENIAIWFGGPDYVLGQGSDPQTHSEAALGTVPRPNT